MHFRNSKGRWFSTPTADILAVTRRIRAWRIAGERISTAENLLVELDRLADAYPGHVRRVECLRASLVESILSSIISIPSAEAVV